MRNIYTVIIAVFFISLAGCVEDKRLSKYDQYYVPTEKLTQINKVQLQEAEDQSMEESSMFVSIKPGEINELTLEECRVLALENNLTLKIDSFKPVLAEEELKQAHAAFEPSFNSSFSFVNNDYPDSDGEEKIKDLSNSINFPLVTGGSISLGVGLDSSEADDDRTGTYSKFNPDTGEMEDYSVPLSNIYYRSNANVQYSQPLLKGAGVDISTYKIRLKSYSLKQALIANKLSAMSVLVAVDKAYWNLYAQQKALDVRKLEYELAQAQYNRSKRMLELKQIKQIEVLRAENSMAQSKTAILSANNSLRKAQRDLKQILNTEGMEVESDSVIIAKSEPLTVKYVIEKDEILQYALDNRMELLDYELQLASQESSLAFSKNSLLPSLSFKYIYSGNGIGATNYDSIDMLDDGSRLTHSFGLNYSMPLGNRAAKSSYRSAIIGRRMILANKAKTEISIKNEVLEAIENLETNWNKIITTANSVVVAKKTMEAEQRQFNLGMQMSTEVLRTQAEYANALLEQLQEVVTYQINQVDLCYKIGGLNTAANLEFDVESVGGLN